MFRPLASFSTKLLVNAFSAVTKLPLWSEETIEMTGSTHSVWDVKDLCASPVIVRHSSAAKYENIIILTTSGSETSLANILSKLFLCLVKCLIRLVNEMANHLAINQIRKNAFSADLFSLNLLTPTFICMRQVVATISFIFSKDTLVTRDPTKLFQQCSNKLIF